jgi:hypothetical protein
MSREASSNYGVGTDGRVALYIDEANRSWCTSSSANDNRAVTIEVANDENKEPWHVSDKALAALIELVADICKRNGIKKLLWKADKNLIGQVDKQNMTVHRWFAAKSCPGNYLYEKHGYIADEVNKRLGVAAVTLPTVAPPATNPPSAATADETIWNFLKGKGLNDFAIAGVMGNLFAESALNPKNLQNSYEKSLKLTDDTYTKGVDNGTYTNFVNDSAGYGLAQWTYYTRKQGLLDFAKAEKASIGDLTMQLNFLWKELQSYAAVIKTLKSATSLLEASNVVLLQFERPADQSASVQAKRAGYGQTYYDKYASKTAAPPKPNTATTPAAFAQYKVKITANALNYRSGAGTNFPVKGSVKKNEVFNIVAESDGAGAKKWGKLLSGAGWISLDYTVKC